MWICDPITFLTLSPPNECGLPISQRNCISSVSNIFSLIMLVKFLRSSTMKMYLSYPQFGFLRIQVRQFLKKMETSSGLRNVRSTGGTYMLWSNCQALLIRGILWFGNFSIVVRQFVHGIAMKQITEFYVRKSSHFTSKHTLSRLCWSHCYHRKRLPWHLSTINIFRYYHFH